VFLVLGLLAGGLICLLLINTILDTGSVEITNLQQQNVRLAQQSQALQEQIASEQTPDSLYARARRLGMVEPPLAHYLDLRKGRIISQPGHVTGIVYYPPGYTP
jgi:cell division protein FtsB